MNPYSFLEESHRFTDHSLLMLEVPAAFDSTDAEEIWSIELLINAKKRRTLGPKDQE